METIETDYLVIGAGAVGLSFADALLAESSATMVVVDRRHAPGGHWNDAYPFVRLHQPSLFYGVASMELGSGRIDDAGPNAGNFELASGPEVVTYFERVMRERLLPSGRVRYLPMHDVVSTDNGGALVRGRLGGADRKIVVNRKIVDGTYYNTTIPSTHQRKFDVAPGVDCIAPNDLPRRAPGAGRFVILGGGKTAMDVGVWLLENGVDPDAVVWVRPRDSWLINRDTTQPTSRFFHQSIGSMATQMEAAVVATSVDDLFDRLEAADIMLRIDPTTRPEMFHYATISIGEVELLRRIGDVRRGARVTRIEPGALAFTDGARSSTPPGALYIDCTATAVERRPPVPTFNGDRITLQMVRLPNPAFSAALAAYVEAHYTDEAEKNRLCAACPLPDSPADWPAATVANMMNQYAWNQDKTLRDWITRCRLDGFGQVVRDADKSDPAQAAVLQRLKEAIMPAVMNLQRLAAQPDAA
ncbi:MAG: NAD(P)-binding protein [Alphaproteobacteria bacterium]|nr:NAD(P)-binding protein [Alphaproteobacteria bacterium]